MIREHNRQAREITKACPEVIGLATQGNTKNTWEKQHITRYASEFRSSDR
jgi:hypothetical protein